MKNNIFQLIYISKFCSDNHNSPDKELSNIVEKSSINNKKLSITGMLFFRNNYFIQILEGDMDSVKDLYDKISKDKRHENIKTLQTIECSERIYQDWSMSHYHIIPQDESSLLLTYKWDNIILNHSNEYDVSYAKLKDFFLFFNSMKISL